MSPGQERKEFLGREMGYHKYYRKVKESEDQRKTLNGTPLSSSLGPEGWGWGSIGFS